MLTSMKAITLRKFLLLVVLLMFVATLSLSNATKQAEAKGMLPCCSACDVDPPPLFCRHGCTPGC
jgi:hypothetical protein